MSACGGGEKTETESTGEPKELHYSQVAMLWTFILELTHNVTYKKMSSDNFLIGRAEVVTPDFRGSRGVSRAEAWHPIVNGDGHRWPALAAALPHVFFFFRFPGRSVPGR